MEQSKNRPRDHRRMSKPELAERLEALQRSFPSRQERDEDPREKELQTVLHELEVYQVELDMQVRELQESRQALEESHERYVSLYDFAPVGYITLSPQGTILEINLTAASLLGVERQWLVDRTLSPWVLGVDLPLFRAHLRESQKAGGTVKALLHFVGRDKKLIPVELSTSSLADPVTGAAVLRTAVTDLTDRLRAEAELDRFFNLSTDLLCILGRDGRFRRLNPAFQPTLGYSPEELLGRRCLDFIHPEDREAAFGALRRLDREGASLAAFENRYLRRDRSVVRLSWSAMTSGDLIYCVGRDITAQAEERIDTENQYRWLQEVVRLIPIPLSIVESGSGRLMSISETARQLFKEFPQDVSKLAEGEAFSADLQGNRLPVDAWPRLRASRGEELMNEPAIWYSPPEIKHLLVSSRNIPEGYNQPPMSVIVSQDVSTLKQVEGELRETVDKLRMERDLRERFVFALTHDLRTPLTSARVCAELLGREVAEPSIQRSLSQRMVGSIDRIDQMIRDLLDVSRIRAGEKLPHKVTRFDLNRLLHRTLDDLATVHGNRFERKAEVPLMGEWSKHDLRRVIENLVSNAIKYGSKTQPVTVSLWRTQNETVVLSVRNFGNPIPKGEREVLFQQFRRTAGAERGGEEGWGIGLTLVRGIVLAHGGEIQVESGARAGTEFRVVLPLKPSIG